jgi:hypothetical protein
MIRRVILLGTGPRGGEGMTFTEPSADERGDPVALLMGAFFTASEASQGAGRAYIERLKLRAAGRDAPISKKAAGAQLEAIREWGAIPSTDRPLRDAGRIRRPSEILAGLLLPDYLRPSHSADRRRARAARGPGHQNPAEKAHPATLT